MRHITTRALTTIAAIALIATTFSGSTALASDEDGNGAVFTQTNAASGNAVLMFRRAAGGTLVPAGSYATGGSGSEVGLGSQRAVTLSENGQWLFVVDAGSNDIATFSFGLPLVVVGIALIAAAFASGSVILWITGAIAMVAGVLLFASGKRL